MTYDLQVFARSGLTPTVVERVVREQGLEWTMSAETWEAFAPGGAVAFGGDLPVPMEQDDVPEELLELVREPRWFMQIVVEGSGGPSVRAATRMVRELARLTGAAVYDQRRGRVLFNGKRMRPARVESEFEWRVQLAWYALVPSKDSRPPLPDQWLELAARHLPEVTPVRFGAYEPLRYRMDRDGIEPLRKLWKQEDFGADALNLRSVYFDLASPAREGGWAWSRARDVQPVIEDAWMEVDVAGFCDPYWTKAARGWLVNLAEARGCFHALVQVTPPRHTPRTLLPRSRWYGLHPRPQWWNWYGGSYAELVAARLPSSAYTRTRSGLFVCSELPPKVFAQSQAQPDPLADLRAGLVEPEVPLAHNPNLLPAQIMPPDLLACSGR
jgi:hypothetical protein